MNKNSKGFVEFQENRYKILDSYDSIKRQTSNKPVKTEHGNVAEAEIRKWLGELLPKKFSVTSGYIIPPSTYEGDPKEDLKHYDLIVYNSHESPILWIEKNPDQSEQGSNKAIPSEFVFAVFEVKSTLNSEHSKEAITKLNELIPIREYLGKHFICGVIFFELIDSDTFPSTLNNLLPNSELFEMGYMGGIVLRADRNELPESEAGRINIVKAENMEVRKRDSNIGKKKLSIYENGAHSKIININDYDIYARIDWGEEHFVLFTWQLVSLISGLFDDMDKPNLFDIKYKYCLPIHYNSDYLEYMKSLNER